MEVKVCIGSACHLKVSYDVIEKLKSLLERDGLTDKVALKGSFCLGNCGDHVTVSIDGEIVNASPETIESIYDERIKSKINV